MMDVADKLVPSAWRDELWSLVRECAALHWLFLTKRPGVLQRILPPDWGEGYPNVALGVTVENRRQGLRRLEQLRAIPAHLRFVSIEPLLEDLGEVDWSGIGWAIAGGESGPRVMDLAWARKLRDQCKRNEVPFFFKQVGGPGKDKGGILLDGQLIQERPQFGLASWRP
jgi:protein gp37